MPADIQLSVNTAARNRQTIQEIEDPEMMGLAEK